MEFHCLEPPDWGLIADINMPLKITLQILAPLMAMLAFATSGLAAEKTFSDADRAWWAIQPVTDPAVPAGEHPVDAFIDQKLAAANLRRAPDASPEEFIRRATSSAPSTTTSPTTSLFANNSPRMNSPQTIL